MVFIITPQNIAIITRLAEHSSCGCFLFLYKEDLVAFHLECS